VSVRLHPINTGEIQLRVMDPRPPGHSPGHQSVLLRLRDRYALVCGDAAMSTLELREPVIDGLIVDQDSYIRSGEEAREFMRAHPDTLAIPSHDRELWSRL
jgi:glyoxylase-like metal-dependent hydrolase (beta-lactamase superfamily II)